MQKEAEAARKGLRNCTCHLSQQATDAGVEEVPANVGIHRRQWVVKQIHVCSAHRRSTLVKAAFHTAAYNSRLPCIDSSDHNWHCKHMQRTRSGVAGTR